MAWSFQVTPLDGSGGPDLRRSEGSDPVDRLLGALPGESIAFLDGTSPQGCLLALGVRSWRGPAPRDLEQLRAALGPKELSGAPPPGSFAGGFVGALAYELGVAGETLHLPHPVHPVPPIIGGLVTDFVVWEGARAWLVVGEIEGRDAPGRSQRRTAELLPVLAASPEEPALPEPLGPLTAHTGPDRHALEVEALRAAIARGELYQGNLARRFSRALAGSPRDLFRRLRRFSPAPCSGYLEWSTEEGQSALLSASPELLLEVRGEALRTRPIKGTIGRAPDTAEDERRGERLRSSAKDRAELAMIVDLERNDLGRVARTGSVRVGPFPELVSFASVHHLVADVHATLREGKDTIDVLAALFPGGSITGAPKLAAMEQLAQLEGEGRGFFTGSLGFLDMRGEATFNILIRTLVWHGREGAAEVEFHVGGGITWRSEARLEEEETRVKGAALAALLCGPGETPETLGIDLPGPDSRGEPRRLEPTKPLG